MNKNIFKHLPQHVVEQSISQQEIVVPFEEALQVVHIMQANNILILGWEGWVKTQDGRVGHGNAPQGTVSLENYSIEKAAQICRKTMREASAQWKKENKETNTKLYFCLTVCAEQHNDQATKTR